MTPETSTSLFSWVRLERRLFRGTLLWGLLLRATGLLRLGSWGELMSGLCEWGMALLEWVGRGPGLQMDQRSDQ